MQSEHVESVRPPEMTGRRSFLRWMIHGLGAVFALILGVPAVLFFLDPRNRKAQAGDFHDVAKLNELPVGIPKEFIISETQRDAWTLQPNVIVGRVFLIRRDRGAAGQPAKVDAYTNICPHMGCAVNYTGNKNDAAFLCPCHGARFDIEGDRVNSEQNPAKRSMDSLPVRRKEDDPEIIQVQFKNFYADRPTKDEVK